MADLDEITVENLTTLTETTTVERNKIVEIATSNNAYKSLYTPAELNSFYTAGMLLTYGRKPITWASYESNEFHFGWIYTNRNNNAINYNADCVVATNKVITTGTTQVAPRTVNGKTAGNSNANILLRAGDIQATPAWTPSNDTDLATKKYVDDNAGGSPEWDNIQNKPTFSEVATSGDYDDLSNKPTIPPAQIQSDYTQTDSSELDYIKNKPDLSVYAEKTDLSTVATSGSYNDLSDKPTIPSAQIQSDYGQADTTAVDYIKNKPDLSVYALSSSLATVATSGDYDDLINKPVIPPSWVASPTAPLDTSLLWIDTSDNTVEDLADADNTGY